MKIIFLVDKKDDYVGHYHIMKVLSQIPNTKEIDTKETIIGIRHTYKCIKERISLVRRSINNVIESGYNASDIVHFLTADKFYYFFWLFPGKLNKKNIIFTIHRVPHNRICIYLLKKSAKRIGKIIVLSGYLSKRLIEMGINNVIPIEHSSFYDYSTISDKNSLKKRWGFGNKIVVSILGATRYDKGADIALAAFGKLPDKLKKDVILNIAGKPTDFSEQYIKEKAREYGVVISDTLRELSENEFKEMVCVSDLVLLPYRKKFDSMSGPMSEAFSQGIPCLLPNHGIFKHYAELQGENLSFESENTDALASKLTELLSGDFIQSYQSKISSTFKTDNFVNHHQRLYADL